MAVYSHSTIIAVVMIYSTTTIFSIQSPHIRLMTLVARQLLPHLGQIYLRVLLGFFVLVSAPAPLLPPLGSVPSTSSRLRLSTIWKSCQPCSSNKNPEVQGRAGNCPTIFGMVFDFQTVGFCNVLEILVVVHAVIAGIFYTMFSAILVYHLVD